MRFSFDRVEDRSWGSTFGRGMLRVSALARKPAGTASGAVVQRYPP